MMTQKDIDLIAGVLNDVFDETSGDEISFMTYKYLVHRFADALAETGPWFDRRDFLKKAGAK